MPLSPLCPRSLVSPARLASHSVEALEIGTGLGASRGNANAGRTVEGRLAITAGSNRIAIGAETAAPFRRRRSRPHVHGHGSSTDGLIAGPRGIAATPPNHRRRVRENHCGGCAGRPQQVELIDGYMVDKMGKNAEHRYTTKEVLKALDSRLPAGWTSQKEEPVRIPGYDEPSRTSRSFEVPTPIIDTGFPRPPTWHWWSRSPKPRSVRTGARNARPMPRGGSPSTGSSTWLTARSRSTRGRARAVTDAQGLPSRPAGPGHDRRPALRPIAVDDILP